jgi:ABC-2 type transport system permease protein
MNTITLHHTGGTGSSGTGSAGTVSVGTGSAARAIRNVALLTRMELRLLRREPGVLVGLIGFPAATVLVLAGVFGSHADPDFGGVSPSQHYIVGYVGVVLASMGLVTLPGWLAERRERGVLRRYRASGVGAGTLLAGYVVLAAILGTLACAIVLMVGAALYGISAPTDVPATVAWFVAGLGCFIAIGGALGVMMPSSRAAIAVGNLLFVPMFLLGGGGPPRDVMTGPMRTISDVMPLSHLVGGLRLSWLGTTDDPHLLLWPVLVALTATALAVRIGRRRLGSR